MLRLPLGLSTFAKIRKAGYLYIDKTEHAYNLITQGHRYFLSRPRRFGKSLLVSTLKEILAGNQSLFTDLWISKSNYQWQLHGIVLLDLSAITVSNVDDLRSGLCILLQDIADDYQLNLALNSTKPDIALRALVRALSAKFSHVAILIDEYDSPILQVLHEPQQAKIIRDAVRSFFTVIKSLDALVDFVFITGVSSFAKAGLFSGINNLRILTMDHRWATICGYTDSEIDNYLKIQLQAWENTKKISYEQLRMQIKDWYNGYRFCADNTTIYNPFSIMNALDLQEFKNFWLQSGTPAFLVAELAKKYRQSEHAFLNLESFETTEDALGIFEISAMPLTALMFQTGYLTITAYDSEKRSYKLGYPNFEVRTALQKYLLVVYANLDLTEAESFALKLYSALNQQDMVQLVALIKSILVRVPYLLHGKDEKSYHSMLQVLFGATGLKVYSEHLTSHGRIDMIIELPNLIYLIELKLNSSAEIALQQIEDRKYYEVLQYQHKPIVLLGLAFQRKEQLFEIEYLSKVIDAI